MIDLYFANVGSGKTTLLAKMAQTLNRPKKHSVFLNKITLGKFKLKFKYDKIYCNKPIYNTLKYDIQKDMGKKHIENALILLDEGAIELDNRTPLTKAQKTFLRMHRHYKCDIVVVSQSWEDINIVVRRLYDKIYLMNRLPVKLPILTHITTIREIKKLINITEEGQIIDMYKFKNFITGFKLFYRYPWYRYFNSYDREQLKVIPDTKHEGELPDTKTVATFKTLKRVVFQVSHKLVKALKRLKKGQSIFGQRRARTPRPKRKINDILQLNKDKRKAG